jgi:beta-lactamase regulating signal transducer with metallopeptidase domain
MSDQFWTGNVGLLLLVQGTACVAVGLAVSYVLRHRPARAHQVLLTALPAAVLMPILYLSVGRLGLGLLAPAAPTMPKMAETSVSDIFLDIPVPDDGPAVEAVAESGPWPVDQVVAAVSPCRAAALRVPWHTMGVVCWSVATALLFLRLVLRFLLGWRVVHAAQPLDSEPIRRAVEAAKGRLGVHKPIRIRRSGSVRSPVIWCWSREPVLLVQENAADAGNRADWTGVFCHEVSHWRRLDHLTGLFTEVLRAAFPWHPLLWWAQDRLLRLSEQACDDWVLATGQNDADYAEMLLSLAAERQMAFLPTVIGKEKTMHTRIRRIIQDNGSDPRPGTGWALVVGALALCTTVGVAVAQRRPAGPEPMDTPPTKIVQERRQIEFREPPEVDQQRVAMTRVLERLMQQAEEKKEMLRKGNDLSDRERYIQQIELKLLVEQIEQMKSRLETLGQEPAPPRPRLEAEQRESWEPGFEARFDSLQQKHDELVQSARKRYDELVQSLQQRYDELVQRAEKMKRELEGLRDDQVQKADELKLRLKEAHAETADVEKRMEESKRAQAEAERTRAEQEVERVRRDVAQTRREIEQRARAVQEQLRATSRRPGVIPDERRTPEANVGRTEVRVFKLRQANLEQVRNAAQPVLGRSGQITVDERTNSLIVTATPENMARVEVVIRRLDAAAGNRNRDAEVEELRRQVRGLSEQMQQILKRLDQMAEQDGAGEAGRASDPIQEYKIEY